MSKEIISEDLKRFFKNVMLELKEQGKSLEDYCKGMTEVTKELNKLGNKKVSVKKFMSELNEIRNEVEG